MSKEERRRLITALCFISPWIIGFLAFNVYPFLSSLYFSFCDYSVLSEPVFIGLDNYKELISDEVFWQALYNTFYFAGFSVPIGFLVSLGLAILLNFEVKAKGIFRTIFYMPSLVPMVCLAMLWMWMLEGKLGLINLGLNPVLDIINNLLGTELRGPNWLADPAYAKFGLIIAGLWTLGNTVVIYLAGLQDVPGHLYEAANIDGASFFQKLIHVTIPSISPVIYFNVIMSIIGSFQVFAVPYVLTGGGDGPSRSLLFVATYVFQNAFDNWNMGYACAISMILFVIILLLTLLASKLSSTQVHYEGK